MLQFREELRLGKVPHFADASAENYGLRREDSYGGCNCADLVGHKLAQMSGEVRHLRGGSKHLFDRDLMVFRNALKGFPRHVCFETLTSLGV